VKPASIGSLRCYTALQGLALLQKGNHFVNDVAEVLVKLAPFALAGVMVPSWTKYVIILLGSGRPTLNASMFVLGNATFRFLLGVLALYVMEVKYVQDATANPPGGQATWLIIPGLLLWSLAYYLLRKKPTDDEKIPGWLRALESVKPWMAFGAGFAMVALPGIQYVYFLSGIGVLAASTLAASETLVIMIGFVAFLQLMLLTPIVIFKASGPRGEEAMRKAKVWLTAHEFQVMAAVLFVFGGFVLFLGVQSAVAA